MARTAGAAGNCPSIAPDRTVATTLLATSASSSGRTPASKASRSDSSTHRMAQREAVTCSSWGCTSVMNSSSVRLASYSVMSPVGSMKQM